MPDKFNIKKYVRMLSVACGRKIFQGSILFLLLTGPFFQIIRTFRQDPPPYPESPFLGNGIFFSIISVMDHSLRNFLDYFYRDISGGPYSLKIFFFHFVEPLTSAVYAVANLFHPDSWNIYLFFSFLVPLIVAMVFGRFFCGYVCPMSIIVSLNLKLQNRYFKRGSSVSASPVKQSPWVSWYLFSLIAIVLLQPMLLQYILPPAIMQHAYTDFILFGQLTLWGLSFVLLFVLELARPAYFCRRLCPTGHFLNKLGKTRLVQIDYKPGVKCQSGCHLCNEACWLGLNPKGHADDPACDICNRCVEHCPTDRLVLSWKNNKKFSNSKPIVFFVFIPFLVFFAELQAQNYLGYEKPSSFSILAEKRIILQPVMPGNSAKLFYSIVSSENIRNDGGIASVNIHIQEGSEMYRKAVQINITANNKKIAETTLQSVNYPVSIRNPSVYRMNFPFVPGKSYVFEVNFPENDFSTVVFHFQYPKTRF